MVAPSPKLLAEWFWTDRWMGSSAFLLPMEARGLYREMLTQAWRRGGRLPADPEAIQRATGCTSAEWDRCWPKVSRYWREDGGDLVNDTQLEVLAMSFELNHLAVKGGQARTKDADRDEHGRLLPAATSRQVQPASPAGKSSRVQPPSPSPSPSPSLTPEDCVPSERLSGRGDFPALVLAWNRAAEDAGMPKVTAVSPSRLKSIKARLAEEPDVEVWAKAFVLICADSFSRGENDRGWKADFDYALRPQKCDKWLDLARTWERTGDQPKGKKRGIDWAVLDSIDAEEKKAV